jgi:alpha-beta hydrolase superfamily lysophospholipase
MSSEEESGAASAVEVVEEWLVAGDAPRFARRWTPAAVVLARLLVVHGYAEHSGRYDRFARQLAAAGIQVLSPDLGSHGRSGGERARVERIDDLVADAQRALDRLSSSGGARPFVLGHSMGGLVATALALTDQDRIAGLILSGAAVSDPSGIESLLALDPFPEVILDSAHLSRDPRVAADYDADTLNYRGPMLRETVRSLARGARDVRARWQELRLPLLVLHGGDDALVPSLGSEELADRARSIDKQLEVLRGLRHEILNEPEGPQITARIIDWIRSRLEG